MYSVRKPLRIIDNIVSNKPRLFILISIVVVSVLAVPIIIPHTSHPQHIYHIILHIASLIFSLFLLIVSISSYIRNGGSTSTISWHIKKLREAGILRMIHGNDRLFIALQVRQ